MAAKESKQRPPSALGQALKVYRDTHKFTQEELAVLLSVEPRTLRRWENGETILTDIHELKRIADRLGIEHEHLGVATSIYTPLTIEQINTKLDRIWELVDEAHISEARIIAERLVQEVSHQLATDHAQFLHALTRIYHAAAFATSLHVRTDEVGQAIYYYQQMEYFARQLKNDTLLAISLTYQGDIFRRKGDMSRAVEYLEAARDTTPLADTSARGNGLQLLGRVYLSVNKISDFNTVLRGAEELAHIAGEHASTGNQYNLAMVYEEYAKSYGVLGRVQQGLDYVDLAEKVRPPTKSSEVLLKVARAEILLKSGDIRNGQPLAVEAAIYCRDHGHYRRLERIYALRRHLNQQALHYGKAEQALSDALEGQIEH